MLTVVLLFVAFIVAFSPRIALSNTLEIVRPRTYIWASIIVCSIIGAEVFGRGFSALETLSYMIALLVPLASLFFLKSRKASAAAPLSGGRKVTNIVTWVLLLGIAALFIGLYIADLLSGATT